MPVSRLSFALDRGAIALPEAGEIAVYNATRDTNLGPVPTERLQIIQPFRPEFDAFEQAGYRVYSTAKGPFSAAWIVLPRGRDAARAMIREAASLTEGSVIVDGAKTDGVDGLLKDLRKRANVGEVTSKAHGKIFAATNIETDGWPDSEPAKTPSGYFTAPGVFSADGPDKGSMLLAEILPKVLPKRIADLGAGWGYLASVILKKDGVETLDLIEADQIALACAKRNVTDPRAAFHWADAPSFVSDIRYDAIVTNPPFHTSRKGDPGLGVAFIDTAARLLKPSGQLWLVANRHLPYETALNAAFRDVAELGNDPGFKLFRAARPHKR
jgi:16S rRNA (guanine1207-N2)-methyltransferase